MIMCIARHLITGRNRPSPHFKILLTRAFAALKHGCKAVVFLGICLALFILSGASVRASTNINSTTTEHWAWNDVIGWIDFYSTDSVIVNSEKLTGYASSSAGDISLDCATTRIGNICATSNYSVTNDGSGNLSGWAWNDQFGWISFDCHNVTSSDCDISTYQVWINNTNGIFFNYAWNDVIGWISFNYTNHASENPYSVVTGWTASPALGYLDSATFDTEVASGVQLNSVLWHGNQPIGTSVGFQIAASNSSSGPWIYRGSDGTSNTYYAAGADVSLPLQYTIHETPRYLRYRVTLFSNASGTLSPQVDEVIVNWSP